MLEEDSASLGNVLSNALLPESRVGLCVPAFDSLRFAPSKAQGVVRTGSDREGLAYAMMHQLMRCYQDGGGAELITLSELDHNSAAAQRKTERGMP